MEFSASFSNDAGHTTLHPVGVTVLLCLMVATFLLPRRHSAVPLVLIGSLMSCAQRIMVGSLNFPFLRLLLVVAVLRMLMRSEYRGVRLTGLDALIVIFAFLKIFVFVLYYQSFSALIFIVGTVSDPLFCYIFFRCFLRTWDDFQSLILSFALASLPVALAFAIENSTRQNLFSFLGGVPAFTEIREGKLRCQGPYPHPIMAGCYWAAVLPAIAARWYSPDLSKTLTILATLSAAFIVVLTSSSTPLMALIFILVGVAMFPLRLHMQNVRWALLGLIIVLQFSMKANIWSLIARVNIMGGSTGWHRYNLMEQAYLRFSEWGLLGTNSTEHWGFGLRDVTNQYILEGVRGGFISMVLYIAIIAVSFQRIGKLNKQAIAEGNFPNLINSWSIGVMLFVHITSFLAVSYFGQIINLYWMTIAAAGSLSNESPQNLFSDPDHLIEDIDPQLMNVDQSDLPAEDLQGHFDQYEYEEEYEYEGEDEYEEGGEYA